MANEKLFDVVKGIDMPEISGDFSKPILPKKKIFIKIILPNGEIKIVKKKIKSETIKIDNCEYFFHPAAIYKEKNKATIHYHYGNPKPMMFKHPSHHIITPGLDLTKSLKDGKIVKKDKHGKDTDIIITYNEFISLPNSEKMLYSGVHEITGGMLRRVMDAKIFDDLFKNDLLTKKNMIILLIIIAVIIFGGSFWYMKTQYG